MKKKIILNADDFGLHPAVNAGIVKGFQEGAIRSTSFMPTGAALEEAAELARLHKNLGVGLHITLVAESPILPAEEIPSLLGADGRFLPDHVAFIKRWLSGGIVREELARECAAQFRRAIEEYHLSITHVDSHQHLHVIPTVLSAILVLMKKYDIKKIRIPKEAYFFTGGFSAPLARHVGKWGLSFLAERARNTIRAHGMESPDAFYGMLAGGNMKKAAMQAIFDAIRKNSAKVSEIMLHPGADNAALGEKYPWGYHWEEELQSALCAKKFAEARDFALISYRDL